MAMFLQSNLVHEHLYSLCVYVLDIERITTSTFLRKKKESISGLQTATKQLYLNDLNNLWADAVHTAVKVLKDNFANLISTKTVQRDFYMGAHGSVFLNEKNIVIFDRTRCHHDEHLLTVLMYVLQDANGSSVGPYVN